MNILTVVLNDYGANIKSYIIYDSSDMMRIANRWDCPDEHLINLHCLDPFKGYEKWSELSPNHYRILISRALNVLANLPANERANSKNVNVAMTNFIILAFIFAIEKLTMSQIEHFRINRFDELSVTFDYGASYELQYERPLAKGATEQPEMVKPKLDPSFSIVVDNSDDPSED